MSVPEKIWLYFICDVQGRSYYRDNGVTKSSAQPVPLPEDPKGWEDIQLSFGTAFKYWSLNEAFTVPMMYVGDGADIIRDAITKKGYEEEMYQVILKKNQETGIYELEYRGRLDIAKQKDIPFHGVNINSVQGGILSYLAANEGVEYPLDLDPSNPAVKQLVFDGINLYDKYRYSVVDFTFGAGHFREGFAIPFPFISNEGDSVGISQGSQQYDAITHANNNVDTDNDITAYCAASANYFYSSISPIRIHVEKEILFNGGFMAGGYVEIKLWIETSLGNIYPIYFNGHVSENEAVVIPVDIFIDLAADEKAFLVGKYIIFNIVAIGGFGFNSSDIYVSFTSVNPPSTTYFLEPLDSLKQIVNKMSEGKYTADSEFFKVRKNMVMTSAYAIRNFLNAKLEHSFEDWFNDYDCHYDLGVKVINNVLWVEPKKDLYKDDAPIFSLGEVAKFSHRYADELLVNTGLFGYKSQKYQQKNGKYEYNTTTLFKFPVNSLKKELKKVCVARGDAFGIEFLRSLIFDKTTTDNEGDNETFIINVVKGVTYKYYHGGFTTDETLGQYHIKIPGTLLKPDAITISGAASNNGIFTVLNASYVIVGYTYLTVLEPVTAAALTGLITINSTTQYGVRRVPYTVLNGVLDNTVYNIDEMTPKRMLLAHWNYLAGLLIQQAGEKITFQKADKNGDLETETLLYRIAEKDAEYVGSGTPYFLPIWLEFEAKVPLSFAKVLNNVGTGFIDFYVNGIQLYGLPIGKMDSKPATNGAQEWKLLASAKNSLDTIKLLSLPGLYSVDSMGNSIFTTDLNPLHFNKYGFVLPSKYKHKEIYDDVYHERLDDFISQPAYKQPWEKNDGIIPIQCVVRGLGQIYVEVYDSNGEIYFSAPMQQTNEAAVILPYILYNYGLDISTYGSGTYCVVLSDGVNKFRISEWLDIDDEHPGTGLIEYQHTTNKWNTYFAAFKPQIRVALKLLQWYPDSNFESYMDELSDYELLDGVAIAKRNLRIDFVPDWMGLKLNRILLLNRTLIEGVRYSRTPESKFNKKEVIGYPMYSYLIEISKSINSVGLSTDGSGAADDDTIVYTLDAQAFGFGDQTLDIELPNEN